MSEETNKNDYKILSPTVVKNYEYGWINVNADLALYMLLFMMDGKLLAGQVDGFLLKD